MAQVAQKGGGSPSLETFKVRLGRVLSTDGAMGVPVHCRRVGLGGLKGSLQIQTIL